MPSESVHQRLSRVRKPHVHITYDVETGGAMVKKELPFVMGVMGDFTGNPTEPLKPLTDRKFINIDRDNFSEVMEKLAPELNIRVNNTLSDDNSEMGIQLKFKSMEDFGPANIVQQVEPLRKLFEARQQLQNLLSATGRSDKLTGVLDEILKSTESVEALRKKLETDETTPESK